MSIGPIIVNDVQWTPRYLCLLLWFSFLFSVRRNVLCHILLPFAKSSKCTLFSVKECFCGIAFADYVFVTRSTCTKTNDYDDGAYIKCVRCTSLSMIVCNRFHSCYRSFIVRLAFRHNRIHNIHTHVYLVDPTASNAFGEHTASMQRFTHKNVQWPMINVTLCYIIIITQKNRSTGMPIYVRLNGVVYASRWIRNSCRTSIVYKRYRSNVQRIEDVRYCKISTDKNENLRKKNPLPLPLSPVSCSVYDYRITQGIMIYISYKFDKWSPLYRAISVSSIWFFPCRLLPLHSLSVRFCWPLKGVSKNSSHKKSRRVCVCVWQKRQWRGDNRIEMA